MIKILVVDDEPDLETLIRQKFRQKIREGAYEFVFAENGLTALEKITTHSDIDIVLSDINMPEMDGLTLLGRLNDEWPLVKSVIVSAYGDMENIRSAMNKGAFDFITKPINFEDLSLTVEKTIKQVNQIKDSIRAVQENNIMRMYVDENVLQFMGTKKFEESLTENETVEGTVAFIDICGFTAVSEKESPDTVVTLLNKYFDIMVKEIINQGGIIDKFIGDCIMAVFRGDFHIDRAIDASLAIKEQLNKLSDEQVFLPRVSIGIHSGEMISGNIGSAALRRFDYTVIGDTVNTAQRLQGIAGENQIYIHEECYESIKQSFQCKHIGTFEVKNKTKEMIVYEVLG